MSNSTCHPEETLRKHLDLCEEAYTILQQENSHLKHKASLPDEALLERKQDLLQKLDASNAALKAINETQATLTPVHKSLVNQAQKRIMKIFLLDRENEQLILKASMPTPNNALRNAEKAASQHRVKNIYDTK